MGWAPLGSPTAMFDGFTLDDIEVGEVRLRVRHGGRGPAILLLHGHPRTHATWHRVAPQLARDYTVVCPDLRGYGESSQPPDGPDHAGYSKRAMADDCAALMHVLGHDRFAVAGHDRGALVALRLTLDHPEAVTRLAYLGAVPIGTAMGRAAAVDRAHDDADRAAGRTVACPALVLWGARDDAEAVVPDIRESWRTLAPDLRARPFDSGHHMAEENPDALVRELRAFLSE